jgi:hypothetical protein
VADGTIIKLQDKLAKKFPGARQKAEFKIHIAIGLTGNTKSIGLFSCNTAEIKTIRMKQNVNSVAIRGGMVTNDR